MYWNKKKKQKRKKKNLLDERWHAVIFAWLRIIMQGKRHTQHWMTWKEKRTKKTRTKKIAVFRVPRFANYSLEIRYFFLYFARTSPVYFRAQRQSNHPSSFSFAMCVPLLLLLLLLRFVFQAQYGDAQIANHHDSLDEYLTPTFNKISFLSECLGVSTRERENEPVVNVEQALINCLCCF